MADVLDLYAEPDASQYPVVCVAESPYQLVSEVRQPGLAAPGQPVRYDEEERRAGTCHWFMFLQPLGGWRHVKVTDRRTAQDVAQWRKDVVDRHFPQAPWSTVVLDNLNTPTPAALYDTFTPAEARRRLQKLACRDTPTHGSWLHMAASAFAALSTQGLARRIPDQATVRRRVGAWEASRNAQTVPIHWRFTTAKARRTLKRLYPS